MMSTPVAFVGEYPMGQNQAKMVESATKLCFISRAKWKSSTL